MPHKHTCPCHCRSAWSFHGALLPLAVAAQSLGLGTGASHFVQRLQLSPEGTNGAGLSLAFPVK